MKPVTPCSNPKKWAYHDLYITDEKNRPQDSGSGQTWNLSYSEARADEMQILALPRTQQGQPPVTYRMHKGLGLEHSGRAVGNLLGTPKALGLVHRATKQTNETQPVNQNSTLLQLHGE